MDIIYLCVLCGLFKTIILKGLQQLLFMDMEAVIASFSSHHDCNHHSSTIHISHEYRSDSSSTGLIGKEHDVAKTA
jgi:hypothetical protein